MARPIAPMTLITEARWMPWMNASLAASINGAASRSGSCAAISVRVLPDFAEFFDGLGRGENEQLDASPRRFLGHFIHHRKCSVRTAPDDQTLALPRDFLSIRPNANVPNRICMSSVCRGSPARTAG
jgi:hypothetical protein